MGDNGGGVDCLDDLLEDVVFELLISRLSEERDLVV